MSPTAISSDPATAPAAVLSVLQSHEFREAYHAAIDRPGISPAAQETTARSIIETYFGLELIDAATPLHAEAVYFTTHPVDVHGHAKFLIPGAVDRHLVPGPLFRLKPKILQPTDAESPATASTPAAAQQLVEFKDFGRAVAAVEAVRLTLIPERVNGIISFIAAAKQHYIAGEIDRAEHAIGTAMDHFNRAANDGLRRIPTEAERGKRGNELAGTRRRLADLRLKLQQECDCAKPQLL